MILGDLNAKIDHLIHAVDYLHSTLDGLQRDYAKNGRNSSKQDLVNWVANTLGAVDEHRLQLLKAQKSKDFYHIWFAARQLVERNRLFPGVYKHQYAAGTSLTSAFEAVFDAAGEIVFGIKRFQFFEAVRLLRRLLPDRKAVGYFVPPGAEVVRFLANPSLQFPASEIESLEWSESPNSPVKMMVNFMGLAAPNGVLPPPYTELIMERATKKVGKDKNGKDKFDNGFRDFLDIFNHRFISFFYRVWEKHHFFVPYEEKETDQITSLLFSFIGLGTKGLLHRQVVSDQTLAYYAGLLGQRPRSAQAIQQILEDYFEVPVEVVQFVGRWVRLPVSDQTQFEDTESIHVQLGFGAVAGDEIWDQQSMVRIKLGPLSLAQYLDFLPTPQGRAYTSLKSLLKFYSNDQLDFQVQLVLRQEETPSLQLTGEVGGNVLLGWVTWIKNVPLGRNPEETILEM